MSTFDKQVEKIRESLKTETDSVARNLGQGIVDGYDRAKARAAILDDLDEMEGRTVARVERPACGYLCIYFTDGTYCPLTTDRHGEDIEVARGLALVY